MRTNKSPVTSLRSRWNRAFAVLFTVVAVAAIAIFAGTSVLVGAFRQTAERVEHEATLLAQLRADVVTHADFLHQVMDGLRGEARGASEAEAAADFSKVISNSRTAEGRRFLQLGSDHWRATLDTSVGELGPSTPLTERLHQHQVLSDRSAALSKLIGQGGAADRAGARADLARAARLETVARFVLVALALLVAALLFRLARRLSDRGDRAGGHPARLRQPPGRR